MVEAAAGDAQFQAASDQSLLICFGAQITPETHQQVMKLLRLLETEPVPGVRNLHPAYCSLLVKFDAFALTHHELEAILRPYLDRVEALRLPEPRQVEIPVCYGGELGPDLEEAATLRGMTPAQAVKLHTSGDYVVSFSGFRAGVCVPARSTGRVFDSARSGTAAEGPGRQRGDRRQPDGSVPP